MIVKGMTPKLSQRGAKLYQSSSEYCDTLSSDEN